MALQRQVLNDIHLFIEVVNHGSFTKAAEALEMPTSTLSRRISSLENHIGFKLLQRTTRRVEVTEEGRAYHQRCKHLVEEAHIAHEEISQAVQLASGMLRITCTPDFASYYLAPALMAYARTYPAVSVELSLSSRVEDLMANHLDLAIRMGPLEDSALMARSLGTLSQGLYSSPDFLAKNPPLKKPSDLSGVECLRLTAGERGSHWTLKRQGDSKEKGDKVKVKVQGRFVAGGPHIACQLLLEGYGVGLLGTKIAEEQLKQGRLVRVLPGWEPVGVQVYAITLSRLRPARVRLFIEALEKVL